ncbi:MAG: putative 4-hydroxybenzoate polyprenyltransferase [Trueperaceae bacterium]|nr:putative 4-hydroxybenzoate polyprenyltransferase [Trueperaceae bacterium]MCC6309281.1 4-hydroxybenzoate octaprenyltransferase [Trueperaceae bacterium]MCO5172891.1 putative 4-hydroxybenzoate polyprenyltransferase [Trueperaceae bacterium]MCW5821086.1 putative 4-hydroxybenzoate polyprenyltransferase [Trueperaceae bacterium]
MPSRKLPNSTDVTGGVRTGGGGRLTFATLASFVKLEHTLFALPFAYGGMLLAAGGWPGWRVFLLVTLAMVGARTAAMAANRVIDAELDALNPRTAGREIPVGKLTARDGRLVALVSLLVLAVTAALLNPLTLVLLPVAVAFLVAYPYTKRFTWACHLWLGLTIGAAAAGGYIAVSGAFAPAAWLLWLGVGAWVAGFDVVYALLDREFDLNHGVRSIPARFGVAGARAWAAALHGLALAALAAVPFVSDLGWPYWLALTVTALVLAWQHLALRSRTAGEVLAAFNANLVVGLLMLGGIVLGLVVPG